MWGERNGLSVVINDQIEGLVGRDRKKLFKDWQTTIDSLKPASRLMLYYFVLGRGGEFDDLVTQFPRDNQGFTNAVSKDFNEFVSSDRARKAQFGDVEIDKIKELLNDISLSSFQNRIVMPCFVGIETYLKKKDNF